jgi:NADPH:quinone reductase-like Zn-dependent oxidoreductase
VKAAVQRAHGGVDVIDIADVPDPEAGPGEVVIAVQAASLNRLDVLQRQGPALIPGFGLPHIAGMDVAGEILAVGDGVDPVRLGERVVVNPALHCGTCPSCISGDDCRCPSMRVVGANRQGGHAELCAVPATHAYRIPHHVGMVEAATIPTIYSTAWHALFETAELRLGETVLIHAAGSGVSTAAIQLAKRAGATVLASARSDAKLDHARKLGADAVVNSDRHSVVVAARELTGGRGVDVVFDHVGPALFEASIQALRPRGRLVFCGSTTGAHATLNLPYAYHFGIRLLGADSYQYAEFERMLDFYWRGSFEPVVDHELPLTEIARAHELMAAGDVLGKIVLRPS